MALNALFRLFALVSLAAVVTADEYWIFGGSRPIVTTRLDPVVSPGAVGTVNGLCSRVADHRLCIGQFSRPLRRWRESVQGRV